MGSNTPLEADPSDDDKQPEEMDQQAGDDSRTHEPIPLPPSPTKFPRYLSLELLSIICEAVLYESVGGETRPNHRQDLIHLGRTCKSLHDVVQPILYREITTNGPDRLPWETLRKINLVKLIRTLVESPWRSRHIRHISLLDSIPCSGCPSPEENHQLIHCNMKGDMTPIEAALEGLFFPRDRSVPVAIPSIPTDIGEWHQQALTPLIVLMCLAGISSSAEIYLCKGWWNDRVAEAMARRELSVYGFLWDRLVLIAPPGRPVFDAMIVRAFLSNARRLKALELRGFGSLTPPHRGLYVSRHRTGDDFTLPEQVTSLVLDHTGLCAPTMRHIASTSRQLSRLCIYYDASKPCDEDDEWPYSIHVAHLIRALTRDEGGLQKGLENLDIDGSKFADGATEVCYDPSTKSEEKVLRWRSKGVAQGVALFSNLQILGINHWVLDQVGDSVLADLVGGCGRLEGLVLREADEVSRDALLFFARSVSANTFRNLRMVKLVSSVGSCSKICIELLEKLKTLAENPVPDLFWEGNVELILEAGDHDDRAKPFVELERRMQLRELNLQQMRDRKPGRHRY